MAVGASGPSEYSTTQFIKRVAVWAQPPRRKLYLRWMQETKKNPG